MAELATCSLLLGEKENQGVRGDVPILCLISGLESFLALQGPVKARLQLLVMRGVVEKKHDHWKA